LLDIVVSFGILVQKQFRKYTKDGEPEDEKEDVPDEEEAKREEWERVDHRCDGRQTGNYDRPDPSCIGVFVGIMGARKIFAVQAYDGTGEDQLNDTENAENNLAR